MPHTPLVTRVEMPRYGVSTDFLGQFDVRPLEVKIETGGALGTAVMRWRKLGESVWSAALKSSPRAPWTWSPARAGADITFAAGTYVLNSTYTIDEAGNVSTAGGGIDAVTAARFDEVELETQAVSDEATDLLQPRYVLPLVSWGATVKRHAAIWIRWRLKARLGMSPEKVAVGDDLVIAEGEASREYFRFQGMAQSKSAEIVDSSSGADPIAPAIFELPISSPV